MKDNNANAVFTVSHIHAEIETQNPLYESHTRKEVIVDYSQDRIALKQQQQHKSMVYSKKKAQPFQKGKHDITTISSISNNNNNNNILCVTLNNNNLNDLNKTQNNDFCNYNELTLNDDSLYRPTRNNYSIESKKIDLSSLGDVSAISYRRSRSVNKEVKAIAKEGLHMQFDHNERTRPMDLIFFEKRTKDSGNNKERGVKGKKYIDKRNLMVNKETTFYTYYQKRQLKVSDYVLPNGKFRTLKTEDNKDDKKNVRKRSAQKTYTTKEVKPKSRLNSKDKDKDKDVSVTSNNDVKHVRQDSSDLRGGRIDFNSVIMSNNDQQVVPYKKLITVLDEVLTNKYKRIAFNAIRNYGVQSNISNYPLAIETLSIDTVNYDNSNKYQSQEVNTTLTSNTIFKPLQLKPEVFTKANKVGSLLHVVFIQRKWKEWYSNNKRKEVANVSVSVHKHETTNVNEDERSGVSEEDEQQQQHQQHVKMVNVMSKNVNVLITKIIVKEGNRMLMNISFIQKEVKKYLLYLKYMKEKNKNTIRVAERFDVQVKETQPKIMNKVNNTITFSLNNVNIKEHEYSNNNMKNVNIQFKSAHNKQLPQKSLTTFNKDKDKLNNIFNKYLVTFLSIKFLLIHEQQKQFDFIKILINRITRNSKEYVYKLIRTPNNLLHKTSFAIGHTFYYGTLRRYLSILLNHNHSTYEKHNNINNNIIHSEIIQLLKTTLPKYFLPTHNKKVIPYINNEQRQLLEMTNLYTTNDLITLSQFIMWFIHKENSLKTSHTSTQKLILNRLSRKSSKIFKSNNTNIFALIRLINIIDDNLTSGKYCLDCYCLIPNDNCANCNCHLNGDEPSFNAKDNIVHIIENPEKTKASNSNTNSNRSYLRNIKLNVRKIEEKKITVDSDEEIDVLSNIKKREYNEYEKRQFDNLIQRARSPRNGMFVNMMTMNNNTVRSRRSPQQQNSRMIFIDKETSYGDNNNNIRAMKNHYTVKNQTLKKFIINKRKTQDYLRLRDFSFDSNV